MPRGTTRTPGADPTRLPLGLDLRALSIAEGVRAGLAAALPVAASQWLNQPLLGLAALGALLTCIVDPGGPLRRRLPILLGFVVTGALLIGGFGLLRSTGITLTLAVAAPVLFALGYLRAWGAAAAALGNLLGVVLILGTDEPLDLAAAISVADIFAAGGVWALLLTLALWRIHPFGPARRSVADVWDALASLAHLLQRDLARPQTDDTGWEDSARAGRAIVRTAIERARDILMATVDARGPASGPATQNLMRLEAADQIFGVMIALSDELEGAPQAARQAAFGLLRRLRPIFRIMAGATERETILRQPRLERAVAGLALPVSPPPIDGITNVIIERLRVAMRLVDPAQYLPGSGVQGDAGVPLRQRLAAPASANFTFRSATFRHALRVALVVSLALSYTLLHHGPYTHWLTITLVLVMQPFFAATWQRTLERVGGTLFGGLVAGLLSTLMHSRMHLAGLLPVLGALALAVRQVSYAVYIAVYTPVVILLVEQIRPLEDQTSIAMARATYTVLGGLIAVAANAVLWPSWQPPQVRADLAAAIKAHAAYAAAVFSSAASEHAARRRAAGLASNNLEASLQRALHEPRLGQGDWLRTALVADGILRRIAGRLTALSLDPPAFAGPAMEDTLRWVPLALLEIAESRPLPPRHAKLGVERLDRLARQVELLGSTLQAAQAKP